MAIQMNVSGLRRNLKNIAHNYTDAQVKVREATSNDPWGPSSTLMSEIADLTYNVVAFGEVMQMVWKRLNDHGRNWRHVYKALVLLEYLIKTGTEKIADQCRENIFSIQTLKDFQYLEENKDMGINVREKAKSLVALLKDDERLRNERVRALKAKERFAQSVSGIGSDATFVTSSNRTEREAFGIAESCLPASPSAAELESARPQTVGEEELQLQLALAMSKEEADQEEAKRKSDDVRLQMALSQSEVDYTSPHRSAGTVLESRDRDRSREKDKSALTDLLDINFNPSHPKGGLAASSSMSALPSSSSMSSSNAAAVVDPWGVPVGGGGPPGALSALSSGSMSPLNVLSTSASAAVTKPSLLDVFHDSDAASVISSSSANNLNAPLTADPWSSPSSAPHSRVTSPPTTNDPWNPVPPKSPEPSVDDPWAPIASVNDPWACLSLTTPSQPQVDPFAPIAAENHDEFSVISAREKAINNGVDDMFNLDGFESDLPPCENGTRSKSPTAFLGENSALVNLDNLVSRKAVAAAGIGGTSSPSYQNMNSLHPHLSQNNMNMNNNNSPVNGITFTTDLDLDFCTSTSITKIPNGNPTLYNNNINNNNTCHMNNNNNNNNNNNTTTPTTNPFLSSTTNPAAPPFVAGGGGGGANPFCGAPPPPPHNPFQVHQAPKPSLNEMRTTTTGTSPSPSPWGTNNGDRENGASPFML